MKPLFILATLLLSGCAATPATLLADTMACGAQVPQGYALESTIEVGKLDVHVVDAGGILLPKASVQAIGPNAQYHIACLSGANAETGGDGVARLDRMKVGNYRVSALVTSGDRTLKAEGFVRISHGQATTVTLTVKPFN
ncbi:MAG: hypothetical protein JWM80_5592 [Cyanobacteria bacterium RYN_339]|nr:hypothetical protein [Cyanobacteria bacterium RYN_339]